MAEPVFSVSDFVAVLNQTMEYAYPSATIVGELANLRVSKNRWLYFDLKDDYSSVKFFGAVQQLPGPLEDGMLLQVRGLPRLHNQYGFSVNVQFMMPVGEGSIKKAAALLEAKLTAEGLFSVERKRPIITPPRSVGLIASGESAAYHDFIKVLNARWGGLDIEHYDVQVQGELAQAQIIGAIEYFNAQAQPVDVIVITRGGGSPEDLAVFNSEAVVRAVAASRIVTMVGVGHEVDVSLAERAADVRASTPSNVAELLVPERAHVSKELQAKRGHMKDVVIGVISAASKDLEHNRSVLGLGVRNVIEHCVGLLRVREDVLSALSPEAILKRGYVVLRQKGRVIGRATMLSAGPTSIQFTDGSEDVLINKIDVQ